MQYLILQDVSLDENFNYTWILVFLVKPPHG